MDWVPAAMTFMIPIVGSIALFAFLAVATWAAERRKEREAYYEHELHKRMLDAGKLDGEDIKALVQYENDAQMAQQKHGLLIGGVVLLGAGIGLCLGLQFIADEAIWMVGFIPLGIGVALLLYALLLAPDVPTRAEIARRTDHAPRS